MCNFNTHSDAFQTLMWMDVKKKKAIKIENDNESCTQMVIRKCNRISSDTMTGDKTAMKLQNGFIKGQKKSIITGEKHNPVPINLACN